MDADDDPSADPSDPVDQADPARPGRSKAGLAATTLSALRAGVRGGPRTPADGAVDLRKRQPPDRSGPEPTAEVGTEPAPAMDADLDTEAVPGDADMHDADPDDADAAGPVRSRPSVLTAVCASVAVAAFVFAAVAGVLWWRADHGTARKIGVAREQVDVDARLAIVTVNTSDYRHPSDALANWLDVSTGALHTQFNQSRSTVVRVLAQAKMVTKATVLDAAVTALDLTKGTASVIASVNVTRTPATGAVSTVRNRFRASMTRTGGEWKLSNLAVVPVSLS